MEEIVTHNGYKAILEYTESNSRFYPVKFSIDVPKEGGFENVAEQYNDKVGYDTAEDCLIQMRFEAIRYIQEELD